MYADSIDDPIVTDNSYSCEEQCLLNDGCTAFTFFSGQCLLAHGTVIRLNITGAISGDCVQIILTQSPTLNPSRLPTTSPSTNPTTSPTAEPTASAADTAGGFEVARCYVCTAASAAATAAAVSDQ